MVHSEAVTPIIPIKLSPSKSCSKSSLNPFITMRIVAIRMMIYAKVFDIKISLKELINVGSKEFNCNSHKDDSKHLSNNI